MMKKILLTILILLLATFVLACGNQATEPVPNHAHSNNPMDDLKNMHILKVEFSTDPASPIQTGQPIILQAKVSMGEETVLDADEVLFEIWKEETDATTHDHHDMSNMDTDNVLSYTEMNDGIYSVETVFAEPGTYNVMYHVTAREQHNMKAQQIIVE